MVSVEEYTDTWGTKIALKMTPEDLLALKYTILFGSSGTTIFDKILEAIREYEHE